ncbi:hypothetical protein ATANTOWER_023121 [Ataeniobius toweri]|uniref:Uncharacterized protein n=1 Tax=Ataeniobius toweri TaxID=208326 RepID=A0ABU7A8J2_9TELE|nr:hypothetical protein [Ataeniobius toweri]
MSSGFLMTEAAFLLSSRLDSLDYFSPTDLELLLTCSVVALTAEHHRMFLHIIWFSFHPVVSGSVHSQTTISPSTVSLRQFLHPFFCCSFSRSISRDSQSNYKPPFFTFRPPRSPADPPRPPCPRSEL